MTTLRGVLRSMEASARRAEREAKRRQSQLINQEREYNKLMEREQAAYEVEVYENKIAVLQSMHQDCSEICDWEKIRNLKAPKEPIRKTEHERNATAKLEEYKPSFFQKLFKKVEKIKQSLELEIGNSKRKDEEIYKNELKVYEKDKMEWEDNVMLAKKIIDGDLQGYKEAIEKLNPFSEIDELGTSIKILFPHKDIIVIDLKVYSDEIIPTEIKSLLKSGKLSTKPMSTGKYYEIYQDHVCSSVLRIARESFAVLPISKVAITAFGNLLNTQTGNKEDAVILSVLIPRETIWKLNFSNIDPSDSMKNFLHNMDFKKTIGFSPVEKIDYEKFI